MFQFILNKVRKKQSIPQLELISIHIPKTAGTSFRHTLYKVYGKKHVLRLDIKENRDIYFNEKLQNKADIPSYIKVIHGHFSYENLISQYPYAKDIKTITWLREPSKRVVSNYYYLSNVWNNILNHQSKENTMNHMKRSLLEYANDEQNRNRMSKFLQGIKLEDLYFIGLVSQYEKDLDDLAKIMEWKNYIYYNINRTKLKKSKENEVTLNEIKQLNFEDYEIYDLAKKIRF